MIANNPYIINFLAGGTKTIIEFPTTRRSFDLLEQVAAGVAEETGEQVNVNAVVAGPVDGVEASYENGQKGEWECNKADLWLRRLHKPNQPGNELRAERIVESVTDDRSGQAIAVQDELDLVAESVGKPKSIKLTNLFNDCIGEAHSYASTSPGFVKGNKIVHATCGTGWNVFIGENWDGESKFEGNRITEDWKVTDDDAIKFANLEGPTRKDYLTGNAESYMCGCDDAKVDVGFKATANNLARLVTKFREGDEDDLKAAALILNESSPAKLGADGIASSNLFGSLYEGKPLSNRDILKEALVNHDFTARALVLHQVRRQAERLKAYGGDDTDLYTINGGMAKALYSVPGAEGLFLKIVNEGRDASQARLRVDDLGMSIFKPFEANIRLSAA